MVKKIFDSFFSIVGLILSLPIILFVSILIKKDSKGPVFYGAKRVGSGGKIFTMYKFRTMVIDADRIGGPSTSGDDSRLTKIGKIIRRYKIDEIPQFINILKGEMSFVGPRPEVPSEVELYDTKVREKIFSVKPGLTDLASLGDLHEEEILAGSIDPHQTYREKIQPQKIKLQLEYIEKKSFWLDVKIIFQTIINIFK